VKKKKIIEQIEEKNMEVELNNLQTIKSSKSEQSVQLHPVNITLAHSKRQETIRKRQQTIKESAQTIIITKE